MLTIGVVSFWKVILLSFSYINHGVAQGCTLSTKLFLIYVHDLFSKIEKCSLLHVGVKFPKNKMSGLLFADDFIALAESGPTLHSLINIVCNYSKCWHFEANF